MLQNQFKKDSSYSEIKSQIISVTHPCSQFEEDETEDFHQDEGVKFENSYQTSFSFNKPLECQK